MTSDLTLQLLADACIEAAKYDCFTRKCYAEGRGAPGPVARQARCNMCPLNHYDGVFTALHAAELTQQQLVLSDVH